MSYTANTFKFSTFLWLVAGLFIPLWPISLPICWFMAYRSYKDGTSLADQIVSAQARSNDWNSPAAISGTRNAQPSNSSNSYVANASSVSPARSYDIEKWTVLKQIDSDIADAVSRVTALGVGYEEKLAKQYLIVGEKAYLGSIVKKLEQEKAEQLAAVQEIDNAEKLAAIERAAEAISDYRDILAKNGDVDPKTEKRVKFVEPYRGRAFAYSGPRGLLIVFEDDSVALYKGGNYWEFADRDSVP